MENVTIDIDKIIQSKMGAKARYVPRFLINYLKRIIHQEWVNVFLVQAKDLKGSEWLWACLN